MTSEDTELVPVLKVAYQDCSGNALDTDKASRYQTKRERERERERERDG